MNKHVTYVVSVIGRGEVTVDGWTQTPPEHRGNHTLVVQVRDTHYCVRIIGADGWLLPDWARQQAMQAVQSLLQTENSARL